MKTILAILLALCFVSLSMAAVCADPWIRADVDRNGTIIWFGSHNGNLVHNFVYYPGLNYAEGDVGYKLKLHKDVFDIIPMVGAVTDPVNSKVINYLPQLYWFSSSGRHYSELWIVGYLAPKEVNTKTAWIQLFERYELLKDFRIGPQVEEYYDLKTDETTATMAGGGIRIPYGKNVTADFSFCRDVKNNANTGRMTFIVCL